jgi:starch synthase
MVTSEMAPWAKTGGLGDVTAGLSSALAASGHDVTVVLPRYRGVDPPDGSATPQGVALGRIQARVSLVDVTLDPGRRAVFVDAPALFDRDGYYGTATGDHPDNAERFAVLAAAALAWGEADPAGGPDVLHAHDWQAGLALALVATMPDRWPMCAGAGRVFTIHNLAYQGRFPLAVADALGLPLEVAAPGGAEFWGELSYLKAGIVYADRVTTVSRGYARETLGAELGFGFERILADRGAAYRGILNGIDIGVWNPATDRWLPAHYAPDDLAGKTACKRALVERVGLPVGDDALRRPLVGMVSRLVEQKGLDLIVEASRDLLALDASWVFLGAGDPRFEAALGALAREAPTRVATTIGFDEGLAHLIEAGADAYLMPSRFEPCGLNQMYSLRYGTVPIVRAVGGLDDTVRNYMPWARRPNGFTFRQATPRALVRAVRRALGVFATDPVTWGRLVSQGMAEDHSWDRAAAEYGKVYRRARHRRRGGGVQET